MDWKCKHGNPQTFRSIALPDSEARLVMNQHYLNEVIDCGNWMAWKEEVYRKKVLVDGYTIARNEVLTLPYKTKRLFFETLSLIELRHVPSA